MGGWPRWGIRSWLLFLVMVAALPLFLFTAVAIGELGRSRRDAVEASLFRRAEAAAAAVERRLAEATAYLHALASSGAARDDDLEALYEHARRLLPMNPEVLAIALVDARGEQSFNTLRPFGAPMPPTGSPETARRVFEMGRAVVSGPFTGTLSPEMVTAVGVPLIRDDTVAYCLRMVLKTTAINTVLGEQGLPAGWTLTVFDSAGVIVARSRAAERYVGTPLPGPIRRALEAGGGTPFNTETVEGTPVRTAVAQVGAGTDWAVAVSVPVAVLNEPVNRSLRFVLVAAALCASVGTLAAWWLARRLSRSIAAASAAAEALRRGERPVLAPTGVAELDGLGAALGAVEAREHRTTLALADAVVAHQQVAAELSMAREDALTGLPGRALFLDLAKEARARAAAHGGRRMAMLFIDLDGFKGVNDRFGHDRGDAVLVRTAAILRETIRETDVAGRIGGDEFVVCASAPAEVMEETAVSIARRVVARVGGIGDGIGCSVGIAVWPDGCPDVACAVKRADEAMYEAKRAGKNRHAIFGVGAKADGDPWSAPSRPGCRCL